MSVNHSVSDLVSIIRNGKLANKKSVVSPVSSLRENVLKILSEEGYISGYAKTNKDGLELFNINLKYHSGDSVIGDIEVVSKPGRRVYCSSDKIPLVKNGLGLVIISTSAGVLSGYQAKLKEVGGEVLLKVF